MRRLKVFYWIPGVIVTISIAYYQRVTGPTHPKDFIVNTQHKEYRYSLPRSQNGYIDAIVRLEIEDPSISGFLYYKRFNTGEAWDTVRLNRENEELVAWLPKQLPAGKLEYGVKLFKNNEELQIRENETVVIRFKDEVPAYVLMPHILLIFTAMLLSTVTGLYAFSRFPSYRIYTFLTLTMFLLGGMIMGPVVQKFAFGEFWTGFPLGKDLTDNKALVAFVFWIVAWLGNRKGKQRYWLVILASIINIGISLIPHSLMGSELDYGTGEIKTGMIFLQSFIK